MSQGSGNYNLINILENRISTTAFNSRDAATLAASATFQGVGEDVSLYGRVGVSVTSSNASDGTLWMEVSRDGTTWGGPPRVISNTQFAQPIMWNIVEKYFRIRYVNGTTTANDFAIQVQYSVNADTVLAHQLSEQLSDDTEGVVTRSVIVGNTEGGGYYSNVSIDGENHLEVAISNPRSAFGEILTSQLTPVSQLDFIYGLNSQITTTTTAVGGTATTSQSSLVLSTAASANSVAMINSNRYLKYRSGEGALARFTALFTTGVANSLQYAGIGTPSLNNGFFFGYSGTTFGIFHRSNGSLVSFTPQSSWSEDICNGAGGSTNKSGINLIPTNGNVFQIKYQYLGFGNIYFFIENSSSGQFVLVHQIKYANNNTDTSLQNPSLNLIWRVENTTNTTVLTLKAGSGALFVEGAIKLLGVKNSFDNNKSLTAGTTTSIFSLKNATTYNGVSNRAQVRLAAISIATDMANTSSGIQVLQIHKNATLGGIPVYTPIFGTTGDNGNTITSGGSIVSADIAGTTITPIPGTSYILFNASVARNANVTIDLKEFDVFMNPGDVLSFVIKTINGGTQQSSVSVNWIEDI